MNKLYPETHDINKASQSQSPTIDTTGGIVLIQILQILDLVVVVL